MKRCWCWGAALPYHTSSLLDRGRRRPRQPSLAYGCAVLTDVEFLALFLDDGYDVTTHVRPFSREEKTGADMMYVKLVICAEFRLQCR